MTQVCVRDYQLGDAARWEAFAAHCPQATFFHRIGWREVIERSFGHRTPKRYFEA